jgi:hypothetical protein
MKTVEVIPCRYWKNHVTGASASLFGAAPWTSEAERPEWSIVEEGFTWRVTSRSGSVRIGLGRKAAKTREEAEAVAAKVRAL